MKLSELTRLNIFAQVLTKVVAKKREPVRLPLQRVPAFNKELRLKLLRAQLLEKVW